MGGVQVAFSSRHFSVFLCRLSVHWLRVVYARLPVAASLLQFLFNHLLFLALLWFGPVTQRVIFEHNLGRSSELFCALDAFLVIQLTLSVY